MRRANEWALRCTRRLDDPGRTPLRVAALLADTIMRARLQDAVMNRADLHFVTRVSELRGVVMSGVRSPARPF